MLRRVAAIGLRPRARLVAIRESARLRPAAALDAAAPECYTRIIVQPPLDPRSLEQTRQLAPSSGPSARPRRRRRLLVIFAVIVSLVACTGAGAFLGVRHEENHWRPLYDRAVTEAAHWKADSEKWQAQTQDLQEQLQDLQKRVTASVGNLNKPHFVLWNTCGAGPAAGCPLGPGREYVVGVPDTFTYFVSFRSTVPVTVWIMSAPNFICRETGKCPWHGWGWRNRTRLNGGVFHDAEGCAGYLAVFFSDQAGILYPDVSITRNPSPQSTGACA